MSHTVVIAAVQLPNSRAPLGQATNAQRRADNLAAAEHWLDRAGQAGADIACLGETFTTDGLLVTPANLLETIEQVPGEITERIGAIARRHQMYIIAPVWGVVAGVPRNVALLFDRGGTYLGGYNKVHLTDPERDLGIVQGDDWPTFTLDFGRIGIQTCLDNSFPESARCLALNGAQIIFWPHVMSGWGDVSMDITYRSRAIDNGVYHVPVCYGCPPDQAWRPGMLIGHSSIVAPDGTIIADAGRHAGIVYATVNLDEPYVIADFLIEGDYVHQVNMRNARRPETYGPLTQPWERTKPVPARGAHAPSDEAA